MIQGTVLASTRRRWSWRWCFWTLLGGGALWPGAFGLRNGCSWSGTCGCNNNQGNNMLLTTRPISAGRNSRYRSPRPAAVARPSQALIDDLQKVDGDIMILGVAGKNGADAGRPPPRPPCPIAAVIGVARFQRQRGVRRGCKPATLKLVIAILLDEAAHQDVAPKVQKHSFSWPGANLARKAIYR